jgi:GT2 family glycosyltransferase
MASNLTVIMVNYDQKKEILECLASLGKSTYKPQQIIISDNGSSDGSIELIRKEFPTTTVILNNANIGYAEANNRAFGVVDIGDNEYLLLLNSDTVVTSSFLENLIVAAERTSFDIVGPKIMYYDRPNIIWFAGGYFNPDRGTYYHRGKGEIDKGQYNEKVFCDFVTGCALLIRKSLFRKLGGYDPKFFMYCEDLDLCLRARAIGARIGYVSDAQLYHKVKDQSSYDAIPLARYYYARNMLYVVKHSKCRVDKRLSYTKSVLYSIKGNLKLVILRPAVGLSGLCGILDFLLSKKGRCRRSFEFVFTRH